MNDLYHCQHCKAVMEPAIELETDTMEFWGAPVTRTMQRLICSDCGGDYIDPVGDDDEEEFIE